VAGARRHHGLLAARHLALDAFGHVGVADLPGPVGGGLSLRVARAGAGTVPQQHVHHVAETALGRHHQRRGAVVSALVGLRATFEQQFGDVGMATVGRVDERRPALAGGAGALVQQALRHVQPPVVGGDHERGFVETVAHVRLRAAFQQRGHHFRIALARRQEQQRIAVGIHGVGVQSLGENGAHGLHVAALHGLQHVVQHVGPRHQRRQRENRQKQAEQGVHGVAGRRKRRRKFSVVAAATSSTESARWRAISSATWRT
jgi:hypothetical protein